MSKTTTDIHAILKRLRYIVSVMGAIAAEETEISSQETREILTWLKGVGDLMDMQNLVYSVTDESIQRDALDALHGMLTNKSAAIMDHFYAVRELECLGWEGPDMVAWGAAIEKAQDVLKRAGRMI